jgi:hypothetical protein
MKRSDVTKPRRRLPRTALALHEHAALTPPRPGSVPVCASVGPDNELLLMWTTADDRDGVQAVTTTPGGPTFPDPKASRPVPAQVSVYSRDPIRHVALSEMALAFPTVQPMPGGGILVVGARARWRSAGPDKNAVIYGPSGGVLTEATLGDGVGHVQTTHQGYVWVGYFDEGVYGNYGWGMHGAPAPIGAPGLIRFSPDLSVDWQYRSDDRPGEGAIDDCYALNVDNETAWVCYYSDFPVVRVDDGRVRSWHNSVTGAKAIVTDGHQVALVGGYGPNRHRIAAGTLHREGFAVTAERELTLPDGRPVPAALAITGRGTELHVVTEDTWYRIDLTEILR